MSSREEFNNQLKEAVKSKDQIAVSTIRLILAALKDRDIAAKSKGNMEGISETEIMSLLQSMIKQRNESIRVYREAGRDELAEREEAEVVVIEKFLPKQLDENEMRSMDLAKEVCCKKSYTWSEGTHVLFAANKSNANKKVVAIDYGAKNNILRCLVQAGCDVTVVPADVTAEVVVIEKFLPKQLDENEMRSIIEQKIAETGANDIKDMGKVMNAMKTDYAGQMDMSKAGALVKEKLAS